MPTEVTSCYEQEIIAVQSGCQHHSPAKQRNIRPNKSQNTGFFEKMVKWVAYDTIGALLPIRMTNFFNTKEDIKIKTKNVFINVPIAYFWLET